MKTITCIITALFCLAPLQAAPDRDMTIKATVHGMVCSFCAQGLIAHFKDQAAVADVHVDLGKKLVILKEKKGASISDAEIKKAVVDSGFKFMKVERSKEAFEAAKK